MNEGAVEPLDVIVFGEGEEDLVADDGEGQQEDGASRHCQGEGAQVQTAKGIEQCLEHSSAGNISLKNKSHYRPPIHPAVLLSCSYRPALSASLRGGNLTRLTMRM